MFETKAEGFVFHCTPDSSAAVAAGPRCALTQHGQLLCSFMVQSKLGINDFVPMIARSADGGLTWTEPVPVFPHMQHSRSLFCSISTGKDGDLFLYGIDTPIDTPGESFWCDATQGMKQNRLFWSQSVDKGVTWTGPAAIPLDGPGTAEAPCPLCVTAGGRWIATYSPYNSFDPAAIVDRSRVVAACSDDRGRMWWHVDALRFPERDSGGAEAWIVELADGRLLATAWHVDHSGTRDYPNAYAMSEDGGRTWSPTRSTGTMGQSTALTALPGGGALFIYNQRKHGTPGVWIAEVDPQPDDFGVRHQQIAWNAATTTQHDTSAGHAEWTDFSFGEPAVVLLPDETMFLVFWCVQPDGAGIRYVKLQK
ncbi:MAG: exo-alpha-sialidase [Bryobacterales bacterium]|nr:exo-alpha-sialidase [Bryobacterales bacterium]